MRRVVCLSLALLLLLAPTASADLIIFGDSLVDTGNVFVATSGMTPDPAFGYFDGRFSNGPVWVETLATLLGVTNPSPSLLGGLNYAWGGARTGNNPLLGQPGEVPWLGDQIFEFLFIDGMTVGAGDLVVLSGGGNDILGDGTAPAVAVANLSQHITDLALIGGGTDFLVSGLPPLGQTPEILQLGDPNLSLFFDGQAVLFNTLLQAEIAALESTLGIDIGFLNLFDLFEDVAADPAAFGLTDITNQAISSGGNDDEFLFWDSIHPTRIAHSFIGLRAQYSVPEPSALALLGLAAIGLGASRRRRAA